MEMEILNCFWDWMVLLSWRLFILMEEPNNPLCSLDKVLFSYFLRINIVFASVGLFSEKVFFKKRAVFKIAWLEIFLLSFFCTLRVCRYACAFWTDLHALCGDTYCMSPCTGGLSSVRVPAGGDQLECCSTYCSSLRPRECAECSPTPPSLLLLFDLDLFNLALHQFCTFVCDII